jgi:hypothetical protein
MRQPIATLQILTDAGRPITEGILFTARDLIVLVIVVVVILWLARQMARK